MLPPHLSAAASQDVRGLQQEQGQRCATGYMARKRVRKAPDRLGVVASPLLEDVTVADVKRARRAAVKRGNRMGLRIKPSKELGGGLGLFAAEPIEKGTWIPYVGFPSNIVSSYTMGWGDVSDCYVDPSLDPHHGGRWERQMCPGAFVNSVYGSIRSPNVQVSKELRELCGKQYPGFVVVKEKILPGQELLGDYKWEKPKKIQKKKIQKKKVGK